MTDTWLYIAHADGSTLSQKVRDFSEAAECALFFGRDDSTYYVVPDPRAEANRRIEEAKLAINTQVFHCPTCKDRVKRPGPCSAECERD